MENQKLYFDYNATTPVHEQVLQRMLPFLQQDFGNPASGHIWGYTARQAVETARKELAGLLQVPSETIVFTSGATESDNLALAGVFPDFTGGLIISAIEHPAILETAHWLAGRGVKLTVVPVDAQGLVDPEEIKRACSHDTKLVSIMLANNETGVIQPVGHIGSWCRERGILLHTDAAQAVGKIPVCPESLNVDMLSIAGHKMYAPKGIGALYVRSGVNLHPITHGGAQEKGLRPGTENVAGIVALGAAADLAAGDLESEGKRQISLKNRLVQGLNRLCRSCVIHGLNVPCLPSTAGIGFPGLSAGDILSGLAARDVAASAGAACHAGEQKLSHVLKAMGVPEEIGAGTIRLSWGRMTSIKDVDELLIRLQASLEEIKE